MADKKKEPKPKTEPASETLKMLVRTIQAQAQQEMMRAIEQAANAEQADRGYPDDARFNPQSMEWTLPEGEED